MKTVIEAAKEYSFPFVIGATLPALLSLNIFATKADLADLRAERAELYATKKELQERSDKIEILLYKLSDKIDRLIEVRGMRGK